MDLRAEAIFGRVGSLRLSWRSRPGCGFARRPRRVFLNMAAKRRPHQARMPAPLPAIHAHHAGCEGMEGLCPVYLPR